MDRRRKANRLPVSFWILDAFDEEIERLCPDFLKRLCHHGQSWTEEIRPIEVIEADKRHVLRHIDSGFAQCAHGADRHQII